MKYLNPPFLPVALRELHTQGAKEAPNNLPHQYVYTIIDKFNPSNSELSYAPPNASPCTKKLTTQEVRERFESEQGQCNTEPND